MRMRTRRLGAAALASALFVTLLGAAVTTDVGSAATPITDFDPGYIISDAVMYDSRSMTEAQIAQFIAAQGASCTPSAGNTCLKDYRETTPTRPATSLCTGTYTGAADETAAAIISKVGIACGINPQVLLVTLQKEQGLITATAGKAPATYARALGFGCPDNTGGVCSAEYAGFANQVYSAAQQLQRYAANPTSYAHRAGAINNIRFSPDASCGSSPVFIQNQGTASLYNYTPYQPNAAALAAGTGTGDACSSYGNRNFHIYFKQWFGLPTGNRTPFGHVDAVTASGPGAVTVSGWAVDRDADSIDVHVRINGQLAGALPATAPRSDIQRLYGKARSGFSGTFATAAGRQDVCVYAINSPAGANPLIGCSTVTVTNQAPRGSLDVVTAGSGTIYVAGWAFDPDTTAAIPVHVYVDGKAAAAVGAAGSRPDVARVYGQGGTSGFSTTVGATNGAHQVCVYAINTPAGPNPMLGCRNVSVANAAPRAALDIVNVASPQQVQVRGWAFDTDSAQPISVRISVDGAAVRTVTANGSRPDVARVFGVRDTTGYDTSIALTAGSRQVCVDSLDASTALPTRVGCRTVSVPNTPTVGAVTDATPDVSGNAAPQVSVSGWAWDYDVPQTPVTVQLTVDGVAAGTTTASATVSPVPAGAGRAQVGWSAKVAASPGTRNVCAVALDPPAGTQRPLGCMQVDVPNRVPFGALDAVAVQTSGTTSSVRVAGWAIDPDSATSVAVHVYVDGKLAGTGVADLARPDVEAAYGLGANRGFAFSVPVASGASEVRVYFINIPAGSNPNILWPSAITVP